MTVDEIFSGVPQSTVEIHLGDNLELLAGLPDASFNLIYIDPPFNTGDIQSREIQKKGKIVSSKISFDDSFSNYLEFITPRLEEAFRLLSSSGSLFVHLDSREAHYVKVALDQIFGRDSFMNEIIWSYDYGGRSRSRWSNKHDTIFWYVKDPDNYCFNFDEIDRIPYMAPGLVGAEKAERGKTPTDVWWNTIVPTNGKEKTGYPTQKPLGILNRIVRVHSTRGDRLLDFFAGSGSFGEAALLNGRSVVLIDSNEAAVKIMKDRLKEYMT